jgi:endoglycosylceramidase
MTLLRLITLGLTLGVASALIQVDPESQHFVDESGRLRLFRGVNAVYKLPPFHPTLHGFDPLNSLSEEDFALLQEW